MIICNKEGWETPFTYFNYSELTEYQKIRAARSACFEFSEDMICGRYKSQMNSEWYGMLLRLLNDLGYDTSEVKEIDWNNIPEEYCIFFLKTARELETVLYQDKFKNCHSPQLTFDRIIPD